MEILVGVDGTEHGLAAVRWAAHEARSLDTQLTLLHVYSVPAVPSPAGPVRLPEQRATAQQHADSLMQRAHQVAREELKGTTVSLGTEVMEGPTVDTLLAMSTNARMLVLGSHSGTIFHHRLGSVVGACLHKARCPVVVVPGDVVATTAEMTTTTSSGTAISSS